MMFFSSTTPAQSLIVSFLLVSSWFQVASGFTASFTNFKPLRSSTTKMLMMGGLSVLEEAPTRVLERPAPTQTTPRRRTATGPVTTAPVPRKDEGTWEVRIYNDNETTREWVTQVLVKVSGISERMSYQTMVQAQKEGSASVGTWIFEVAELYQTEIQNNGISCKLLPVGDSSSSSSCGGGGDETGPAGDSWQ